MSVSIVKKLRVRDWPGNEDLITEAADVIDRMYSALDKCAEALQWAQSEPLPTLENEAISAAIDAIKAARGEL